MYYKIYIIIWYTFRPAVLHLAKKMLSGHATVASLSLSFQGRSSWVWHHLLQMEGRQSLDEQIHCPWNWGSPPVKVEMRILLKTLSLLLSRSFKATAVSVHQVANACVLKWGSLPVMAVLNHVDRDHDHQPIDLRVPLGYPISKRESHIWHIRKGLVQKMPARLSSQAHADQSLSRLTTLSSLGLTVGRTSQIFPILWSDSNSTLVLLVYGCQKLGSALWACCESFCARRDHVQWPCLAGQGWGLSDLGTWSTPRLPRVPKSSGTSLL